MTKKIAIIALIFSVAGCAKVKESKVNPMNWFGSNQSELLI